MSAAGPPQSARPPEGGTGAQRRTGGEDTSADDRAARRTLDASAAPPPDSAPTARRLTLLSRAYCGLCDDMRDAAARVTDAHGWTLEDVDVDAHPALEAQWGDLVPVLFLGAPDAANELCHYHFDAARVEAALAGNDRCASGARAQALIVVAPDPEIR